MIERSFELPFRGEKEAPDIEEFRKKHKIHPDFKITKGKDGAFYIGGVSEFEWLADRDNFIKDLPDGTVRLELLKKMGNGMWYESSVYSK